MEQRIRLEPNPYSAREARRFVDRVLGGWNGPETRDYAVLLVNELVVNAIQHAHTTLEVRVVVDPERIEIGVRDEDPRLPTPRHPDSDDERGRGLLTVDALADDWGVRPEPEGKTVWFGLTSRTTPSRRP